MIKLIKLIWVMQVLVGEWEEWKGKLEIMMVITTPWRNNNKVPITTVRMLVISLIGQKLLVVNLCKWWLL